MTTATAGYRTPIRMFPLLDLAKPEHAYFYGFALADGHLEGGTGRRGRLTIEIGERDLAILEAFQSFFSCRSQSFSRVRDTNFKTGARSVGFRVSDMGFRADLQELGFPVGRKSHIVMPPTAPFSEPDFWRGFIDADGSLGLTGAGFPFVSLTTISEAMALAFQGLVEVVTGRRYHGHRSQRDKAWCITAFKEQAQEIVRYLYYPGCLGLDRKIEKAALVADWMRPDAMRLAPERRHWNHEEEQVLVEFGPVQAAEILDRPIKSTKTHYWRIYGVVARCQPIASIKG